MAVGRGRGIWWRSGLLGLFLLDILCWSQVEATQGTCARHVHQPGVYASRVELVVTGQDSDIFAHGEILCTDRAARMILFGPRFFLCLIWRRSRAHRDGCTLRFAPRNRVVGCFRGRLGRRTIAWWRVSSYHLRGILWQWLDPAGILERRLLVGLSLIGFAKFDDGQGLEHGYGNASCTTPARSAIHARSWAVSFRIAMSAHGSGGNDEQKEQGDQAGDAVQNAHGDGRGIAGAVRLFALDSLGADGDGGDDGLCRGCRKDVANFESIVLTGHGPDAGVWQVWATKKADGFCGAVEQDGGWWGGVVHDDVQHAIWRQVVIFAEGRTRVAGKENNLVHVGNFGEVRVVKSDEVSVDGRDLGQVRLLESGFRCQRYNIKLRPDRRVLCRLESKGHLPPREVGGEILGVDRGNLGHRGGDESCDGQGETRPCEKGGEGRGRHPRALSAEVHGMRRRRRWRTGRLRSR